MKPLAEKRLVDTVRQLLLMQRQTLAAEKTHDR
jgi:hypothetical protein